MMQQIAFLFPGQGSQSLGMLAEMAQAFPIVSATFAQASAALGYDLWQVVQAGPETELNRTAVTQPALLAADIAVYRVFCQLTAARPTVMAGHSLGEYAALVAAGALHFEDAIQLVAKRGKYMQAAVPEGVGAMGAIVGLDDQRVAELCQQAAQGEVVAPANLNSIGQVVIAGHVAAVQRALEAAKPAGAKLAKMIPVSVPSHSPLMQPAAYDLAIDLQQVPLQTPSIPVLHNVSVSSYLDPQQIRRALVDQLVSPVRWVETIQAMHTQGVTQFIECGPGKVLSGLVKRIVDGAAIWTTETPAALNAAIAAVSAGEA